MSTIWTGDQTMLFLRLYLKHKEALRGEYISNSKIWTRVAAELKKYDISTNCLKLDRKFRNMKRTYVNIKKKNLSGTTKWQYYSIMEEIFGAIMNRSFEEEQTIHEPKMEILSEPSVELEKVFLDESNFEEIISDRTPDEEQEVDVDSPYMNLAEELELQRIEELRVIRQTLQEANVIQRERNQILQERNVLMKQYLAITLKYKKRV